MRLAGKLLGSELLWLVVFLLIYLGFSFAPVVYNYRRVPENRYYLGSDDFPLDMIGNLANVREGYLGHWQRFSKFTSTVDSPPALLKFEYILIGQFARLAGSNPFVMFVFTRQLMSVILIVTIVWLVRSGYKSKLTRVLAYLLIFFGTSVTLPRADYFQTVTSRMLHDSLVFVRLTLAAHHYILGGIFGVISVVALARAIDDVRKPWRWWWLSAVAGFFLSWVYAPDTIMILSSLPLVAVVLLWRGKLSSARLRLAALMVSYAFIVLLPVIYVKIAISGLWDWNVYAVTEKLVPFVISFTEYLEIVGAGFVLAMIGLPFFMRRGNTLLVICAAITIMHPVGVFVLTKILDINKVRYFLSLYYIFIGLLAAGSLGELHDWLAGKWKGWLAGKWLATIVLTLLVLVSSSLTYYQTMKRQLICYCLQPDWGYPQKDLMGGIAWLAEHTGEEDIVLSGFFAGTLIPAFAGNRVVTSWWYRLTEAKGLWPLMGQVEAFYRQRMDVAAAAEFMQKNRVRYVISSEEERALQPGGRDLSYPFLSLVYRTGQMSIYQVKLH